LVVSLRRNGPSRAALVDTTLIFHDDIHESKKIHSRSMMRANYKQGLENFSLRN
jgi:hypothetical protein